jgi:hypothetical protein
MAKNDYFVIAYQVLKHLYDSLKCSKPHDPAILSADFFSIDVPYWDYIIKNLYLDGHITGVSVTQTMERPEGIVSIHPHLQITPKGIQYLEENTMFQKVKEVAKDIRGLLPL